MLSIVIPTMNEEEVLPKLLASIKSQDFDDYEIIISDNFSKDRTREIAESYGARVVDGGMPGPGRNRGAEAAKGDKLLFLDADVIMPHEKFLSNIVLHLSSFQKMIACYFQAINRASPMSQKLYFLKTVFSSF